MYNSYVRSRPLDILKKTHMSYLDLTNRGILSDKMQKPINGNQ